MEKKYPLHMNIVLMHGLEGSPSGSKASYLRTRFPTLITPDGRGLPLAERIEQLREATAAGTDWIGVGSSYGGLALTAFVQSEASRFRALLLLAPALIVTEPPVDDPNSLVIPPDLPTTIMHGVHDAVVPLSISYELAARSGDHVSVVELDDTHPLRNSLLAIGDAIDAL
jgi:pimeloyl-ACP methyl ester carboxylesterase